MNDYESFLDLTTGMVETSERLLDYGQEELHHSTAGDMFLARVYRWEDKELQTHYALCSFDKEVNLPDTDSVRLVQLTVVSVFPDGQRSMIAHVFDTYQNGYMKMVLEYPEEQLEQWSENPEKMTENVDHVLEVSMMVDTVLEELKRKEDGNENSGE